MKKILVGLIAMIISAMMAFTLVACGEESADDKGVQLSLNKTEITLVVDAEETLTVKVTNEKDEEVTDEDAVIVWASNNEEVATVSNGTVKGIAIGSAKITATLGELVAECVVTVEDNGPVAVESVTLSKTAVKIELEGHNTLTATVLPENAENKTVVWASDNTDIVTVNDGVVTAVAEGKANVTATVDGKTATCEVTVLWNGVKVSEPAFDQDTNTYNITKASELAWIEQQVNDESNLFSGKTVKLMNDIDLNNKEWMPIGQTGHGQFTGTFDGNGKTVSNLVVDTTEDVTFLAQEHYCSGLFGWLNAGTVKNLTVDGATVKGVRRVAVIAGYLELGAQIIDCTVKNATVVGLHVGEENDNDTCGDKVGVIVGYMNSNCLVSGSTASDSTVSAGRDAGQIVGAGHTAKVVECSATNVTVTAIEGACKGGNVNQEVIGRVLG